MEESDLKLHFIPLDSRVADVCKKDYLIFFLCFKKPSLADCTSHTGTLVEGVGGRRWWWSRLVGAGRVFEVCLLVPVEAKICKGTPHLL